MTDYCENNNCANYSTTITENNKKACDECHSDMVDSANILKSACLGKKIRNSIGLNNVIESHNILEDESIVKHITKLSDGDTLPQSGQMVKVHYSGFLLDGKMFDSSPIDNPFEFCLGQGQVIPLWDKGVATMKKGEESTLVGLSQHCYGENGAGESIPPNSTLLFKIQLIDFYDKHKEIFEMTPEEKIEHMLKFKSEGTEEYKKGNISDALDFYKKSLDHLCDESHNEKKNVLGNISLCYFKLELWRECIEYSDKVLEIDNTNIKSQYRLAYCLHKLGEWELSNDLCKNIDMIEMKNISIENTKKIKQHRKQMSSMCKNMFR